LNELLTEKLKEKLGSTGDPSKDKINLRQIFNNCKPKYAHYYQWKDQSNQEHDRRFFCHFSM